MGDKSSRRKPTITGTHPSTKQPPPTSLPTPAPRAGKLPQSRTRLSRLSAPPLRTHTRETLVVLKLRQKATFIFCIISAHPLTLKWGIVWVHTHPRADQSRGILHLTLRAVTRSQASRYCTHDASQWRSSETEQLWQSSSLFFRTRHPHDDLSCSSAAALAEDLCEHKPSADGDGAVASRSCRWRSRPRRLERHVERRVDRAASAKRSREHGPHARQPATSSLSLAISASDGNGMKKVRGAAAPRAKVCALVTSWRGVRQ